MQEEEAAAAAAEEEEEVKEEGKEADLDGGKTRWGWLPIGF